MNASKSLLIELGTEELPVKALPGLAQAFLNGVVAGLVKRGIAVGHGDARPLYTPRRLAVLLPDVALEQSEQRSEALGPYVNIALDANGAPTAALRGFAQKNGVDPAQLERTTDAKGERFVARSVKPGARTATLVPEIVLEAIAAMPIPKPMRWGDHPWAFARPVHWLVMLHGREVVEGEVFGIRANRTTRGHRFHHPGHVWIESPDDYVEALRGAHVLADPDERRARVRAEVEQAAAEVDGFARVSDSLVDEVNCLVEWPRAILCGFDPEFLRVPHEALISTMESNQKFFPVLNDEHRMTGHFVGIANIDSADPSEVRKGYERVIRPRFADARFFYDQDLEQGLDAMREGLASVTYQQKLGTYADKTARVEMLVDFIVKSFVKIQEEVDPGHARRAAELSRADLQSRLVNEFPELQGIAGKYYAGEAGEPGEVADAIDQAWMPRFAGDAIAPSKLGQVLAIADRLDTLAGGFAAGLKPTGNKDPFALRRAALGLARTIIEGGLDIDLIHVLNFESLSLWSSLNANSPNVVYAKELLEKMRAFGFEPDQQEITTMFARLMNERTCDPQEVFDFILDRLRGYYADQGVPGEQFDAVFVNTSTPQGAGSANHVRVKSILDFDRRLHAIGQFANLPEAPALAAANKRIRNILKKSDDAIPGAVDPSLFDGNAERALHGAVESAIADTDPLLAQRDYVGVLTRLAALRPQVDAFFDGVMVNVDDARVRRNRLALLKRLADRFGAVAEISALASA